MTYPMKRLPELPAERALKVISGRWKAVILYHLFGGPKRLSELTRLAPNASQKVLIQQLREMEEHGLIEREIFREVPPRVEYSATPLGLSLEPVIMTLCDWGRRHAAELDQFGVIAECVVGQPPRRAASSPPVSRAGPEAARSTRRATPGVAASPARPVSKTRPRQ
jgi:DNA-binding HxlR family transcriptional regulator